MNDSQIPRIKRAYRNGFSVGEIATMYKLDKEDVANVLRPKGAKARKRELKVRQRAIQELLDDGCDPAVIAANFGR